MFKWLLPLEPIQAKTEKRKTERGTKDDDQYTCRHADEFNHDGTPHSEEGPRILQEQFTVVLETNRGGKVLSFALAQYAAQR